MVILQSDPYKLRFWSNRILNIRKTPLPIHLSVALTTKCNLNCPFCWWPTKEGDELDIDDLKNFIKALPSLKAIELTGGEPTIYPHINEIIEFCAGRDLKIGLYTNGVEMDNIKWKNYSKLSWVRVSINHYIDNNLPFPWVRPAENILYGANYVIWKKEIPEIDIKKWRDTHNFDYLRFTIDRMATDLSIMYMRTKIMDKYIGYLDDFIEFKLGFATKPYKGTCYMCYLKPWLEANGKVYPCLSEIEAKGYDANNHITDIKHPEKLLEFDGTEKICKYCYYTTWNESIERMLNEPHREFL